MKMERTHVAKTSAPILLREVAADDKSEKRGCYKPAGFWYEVDGDWRRWCEGESFGRGYHLHEVFLNDCEVLFIDSLEKLDRFHEEYHVAEPRGSYVTLEMDWARVAQCYDGIEIAPYQWERRLANDFMWYYGWDCASGVIWRPKNAKVVYIGECNPTVVNDATEASA